LTTGKPGESNLLNAKHKFKTSALIQSYEDRFLRLYRLCNKLTELEGKKIAFFTTVENVKPYKEYIKFNSFPMEGLI